MLPQVTVLLCFAFVTCQAMSQNKLARRIAAIEKSIGELKADVLAEQVEQKKFLSSLSRLGIKLEELLSKLRTEKEEKVAFSVGKSSHQSVTGPAVVTFDREFLNSGNAFNLRTNTFTCPKAGMYAFHMHGLTGNAERRFWAGIYQNNRLLVTAYARVKEFWAMAGNTVLLKLKTGDTLQIKIVKGKNDAYGDNTEVYATFSGFEIS